MSEERITLENPIATGQRVTVLRRDKNMSFPQLIDKMNELHPTDPGWGPLWFSSFENGFKQVIAKSALVAVADALGVTPSYLLHGLIPQRREAVMATRKKYSV